MREWLPVLIIGGVLGAFALIFTVAYACMKNKKEAVGFDRNMPDREILSRLLKYAAPHWRVFTGVLLMMLVSIASSIVSPLIVGYIEGTVKEPGFRLRTLFTAVAVYAVILVVSMACTYLQSIILQKTGQKILSALRMDIFTHIEGLSHNQLNQIPVGTLVTRVTNDTNAISMMFTNTLVTMIQNIFIIIGVLAAMLLLNYLLTLMVLCFVPFVVLFTVIFRKFSRKVYREVKDGTTAINTYLSENLSGIKITQIFNREDRKMADFLERSRKLQRAKQKQIFVFGVFQPIVHILNISCVLCLLYLGGRCYIKDTVFLGQTVTSATLVTFYMYISKFFNPIRTLSEQFNMLQSAFASAEKIFTVMDKQPEVVDAPDAIELENIRGEIE